MLKFLRKKELEILFRADPSGRIVYYPYGAWGRDYFIDSERKKEAIVRGRRRWYVTVLFLYWAIYLTSGFRGLLLLSPPVFLVEWLLQKRQVAGLEISPDRLNAAEERRRHAWQQKMSLLVTYLAGSILFIFVSLVVIVQGEQIAVGVLCLLFSSLCVLVFAWQIRVKKSSAAEFRLQEAGAVEMPPPALPTTEKPFFVRRPYLSGTILLGLIFSVGFTRYLIGIYGTVQCMSLYNPAEVRIAACDKIIADGGFSTFSTADALGAKSQALFAAGRLEEAETLALRSLDLDGENYDGLLGLSLVRYKQEDYKGAVEHVSLAIESVSSEENTPETIRSDRLAFAYLRRGRSYEKMGLTAQAIEDYETSLKFWPEDKVIKERLVALRNGEIGDFRPAGGAPN